MTDGVEPERREIWIAPEIAALDVAETDGPPNRGPDGSRFVDCTRS